MCMSTTEMANVVPTRRSSKVDLDESKWGFSCYDMGGAAPALEADTPAKAVYSASDLTFRSTDKEKVVSTLAFGGYAVRAGDSAARFDNVRVAHNGVECYVNDFNTRRSRSLAVSSATAEYAAERSVFDSLSYPATNNLLYGTAGTTDMTTPGFDGWKRRHSNAKAAAVLENTSNKYLKFNLIKNTYDYAVAAHPIGMNAMSGKLTFRGDMRSPSGTSWWSSKFAYYTLGADEMYTAGYSSASADGQYARVGLNEGGVFYRDSSGKDNAMFGELELSKWYRIVITVDLDTKTFGCAVYYQGSGTGIDAADGTLVASADNLTGMNNISSISCFGIATYGATDVYYDNIKIWYTPSGSEQEELVYSNSFSLRRIYRHEESMVGTLKSEPTGMDGWTRLGASANAVRLAHILAAVPQLPNAVDENPVPGVLVDERVAAHNRFDSADVIRREVLVGVSVEEEAPVLRRQHPQGQPLLQWLRRRHGRLLPAAHRMAVAPI